MTTCIACLHTAHSNVAVFDAAREALGGDLVLRHTVRPDLLAAVEEAGALTPVIEQRTADVLLGLREGADIVLLTCSTLGPVVDGLADDLRGQVLRVDAALAREAVRDGGKVVVLVAVQTTLQPTRQLFEAAAKATGAEVEVRLVDGAWAAFRTGDDERYLALIAAAADEAMERGASLVALAQASMAGAAPRTKAGLKPLTSPAVGLRAAANAAHPPIRIQQ